MANYFENKEKLQQELQPYYREKTNLRLKYAALISLSISIILLLAMAFGVIDKSHPSLWLLMRGCAGLFALIFVILIGILVYRVNTAYFRAKANSRHSRH